MGIALNPSRFAVLTMILDEVSDKVAALNKQGEFEYKSHLGGGVYCVVRSGCYSVHLRKYFVPNDKQYPVPTKNGIALSLQEWRKLLEHLPTIRDDFPELSNATPCHFDSFHSNQEAAFSCIECFPFGAGGLIV